MCEREIAVLNFSKTLQCIITSLDIFGRITVGIKYYNHDYDNNTNVHYPYF